MPDTAVATPKKRGPKTPEGKARSKMNALRHGLRAREFGLLPEDDPAEWRQHVLDLEQGYGPVDATERKLVDAIAGGDVEGDPRRPVRGRGAHRHQAAHGRPQPRQRPAGAGPRRGTDHRAALPGQRRHGRAPRHPRLPRAQEGEAGGAAAAGVHARTRDRRIHERFIRAARPRPAAQPAAGRAAAAGRARPRRVAGRRAGGRGRPVRRIAAPLAAGHDRACGPARAGGARAAQAHRAADRRQRPGRLRGMVREAAEAAVRAHGPAGQHQGRHRGGDQAQPALDARPVSVLLPPARAGAPVRAGLRQRRGAGERGAARGPGRTDPRDPGPARPHRPPARPPAPRLPEELDLAEAICAIKWPKWPAYRGPIDLGLLRRALVGAVIDAPHAQLARRQGDRARVPGGRADPATACWAARGRAGGGRRRRS